TNIGIAPQISYQYNERTAFYASLSLHNRKYYKAPDRKSNGFMFTPSIRYFLDQSSYLSSSIYAGEENSRTEIYGNHSRGFNIAYYKAFNKNINAYLSFNGSNTDYKGIETAYNQSRNDISRTLSGTLSYFIKPMNSALSLKLSRTNNSSNIAMYTYKRNQIGLDISTNF
ncbi:surface lipoprotein assembly modifier, partial [Sulfurimonas sp. NWX79]|uniref:surface lipoprotein assembly modifier n=1 Tax=Sulfurimonas sp. NWX79 TaxID=2925412 RepID=UPI003204E703